MITLAVSVALLVLIAHMVPWTRWAVTAWLVSVPLFLSTALTHQAEVVRLAVVLLCIGWGIIMAFPDRSPFGPLSKAERSCQALILGVSAGARAAYEAHTLAEQRATFVSKLEALDPPNDLWRDVRRAQLLDMRADPPQVGVGDATHRLVPWPWQVALDHRIVRARLQLDDAIRARRLRRHPRPGFDDMTTGMRYDYFFLRVLLKRLDDLRTRDGGMARWHEEAAALLDLTGEVRPPNEDWARLRDLIVEIQGFELRAVSTDLSAAELDRLAHARDEARRAWTEMEERDTRGLASAR